VPSRYQTQAVRTLIDFLVEREQGSRPRMD
jgi:hypothetical protein